MEKNKKKEKKGNNFFKNCWLELKRVSWPSRQVVLHSTWVVIVSTIVFAVILGLCDILLGLLMDLLF